MIDVQDRVGDLVAQDYRLADVFKANGIDFCCGGGISIEKACSKKGLNPDEILAQIQDKLQTSGVDQGMDFRKLPLDLVVDFIEKTHHRYVRENIPYIMQYAEKVARVHGERHPELIEVYELFRGAAADLTFHLNKEEMVLFPYIKALVEAKLNETELERPGFGQASNPIAQMEHEHDTEGERFRRIAFLTDNYTPPADACMSYRVLFEKLKEFEEDLHRHIHLENNILFPGAIALEKRFS